MTGGATFRDALAHLVTPVSVVTTADGRGRPCGVTIGTLSSVSLDPPLVMFCVNRSSGSHPVLTTAARLLVHVLAGDQAAVADRFAQRGADRFAGLTDVWHGLPTIPDTAVRLACARYTTVPAGDHTIVIGLVTETEIGDGTPLLSYGRAYSSPLPLPLVGSR
jgi:flavin reductase (DIM6/NTAB) family NADH-FMN oxidoreductase RutF